MPSIVMNERDTTGNASAQMKGPMRKRLKDIVYKVGTSMHRAVFRVSKGRIVGKAFGMPVVELVTTGRRSGKDRSTMLTAPITDGDRVVLVASFGGDDRHPTWFLNLRANPEVRVKIAGATRAMVARIATEEERARLWPRITTAYAGYAHYQQRTERPIPVVILEPNQPRITHPRQRTSADQGPARQAHHEDSTTRTDQAKDSRSRCSSSNRYAVG